MANRCGPGGRDLQGTSSQLAGQPYETNNFYLSWFVKGAGRILHSSQRRAELHGGNPHIARNLANSVDAPDPEEGRRSDVQRQQLVGEYRVGRDDRAGRPPLVQVGAPLDRQTRGRAADDRELQSAARKNREMAELRRAGLD